MEKGLKRQGRHTLIQASILPDLSNFKVHVLSGVLRIVQRSTC